MVEWGPLVNLTWNDPIVFIGGSLHGKAKPQPKRKTPPINTMSSGPVVPTRPTPILLKIYKDVHVCLKRGSVKF